MRQKKFNIVSQLIHYLSMFTILAVSPLSSILIRMIPLSFTVTAREDAKASEIKKLGLGLKKKYFFLSLYLWWLKLKVALCIKLLLMIQCDPQAYWFEFKQAIHILSPLQSGGYNSCINSKMVNSECFFYPYCRMHNMHVLLLFI